MDGLLFWTLRNKLKGNSKRNAAIFIHKINLKMLSSKFLKLFTGRNHNGRKDISQWRHNEHVGFSNHWRLHCLLNHLFGCRSMKTSKLLLTGLHEGNSPVTSEFPAKRASNVENVSIWWWHHGKILPLSSAFPGCHQYNISIMLHILHFWHNRVQSHVMNLSTIVKYLWHHYYLCQPVCP